MSRYRMQDDLPWSLAFAPEDDGDAVVYCFSDEDSATVHPAEATWSCKNPEVCHRVFRTNVVIEQHPPSTGACALDAQHRATFAPPLSGNYRLFQTSYPTRLHPQGFCTTAVFLSSTISCFPHTFFVPRKHGRCFQVVAPPVLFTDVARACRMAVAALATKEEHV